MLSSTINYTLKPNKCFCGEQIIYDTNKICDSRWQLEIGQITLTTPAQKGRLKTAAIKDNLGPLMQQYTPQPLPSEETQVTVVLAFWGMAVMLRILPRPIYVQAAKRLECG